MESNNSRTETTELHSVAETGLPDGIAEPDAVTVTVPVPVQKGETSSQPSAKVSLQGERIYCHSDIGWH